MRWLVGATIASAMGAFLIMGLYDYFFAGLLSGVAAAAVKPSLFVGAWTAITTGLGMRDVSQKERRLRRLREKAGGENPDVSGLRKNG